MPNNIKVAAELAISAPNLGAINKQAENFNKNMQAGAAALSKASGGTKTMARATRDSRSSEERLYDNARAGIGTGAEGRDFAKQAQGLGGLVRLYATFAANLFAATAAFSALSRAMDTTNMVRGLDQLGAASGTALGSLSKRLFLATEGAVSLREAMEATAKASSAGLNTNQILEMGNVAKKASQALGINMTDSLSRLSRGISKLEPELLDELGIFVKIDDATSKYALSIGKSTSALTDFERRQAFANAVLEQGKKKFDEINIDVNPYTKLAATFQNVAQSGLELINKVLGPIAKVFADNSALVGAAITLIGFKILKMAIPAFGEWQKSLASTAEVARKKASDINTAFGEAWVQRWEARLDLPGLRKGVQQATAELEKVGIAKNTNKATAAGYKALLEGETLSKNQISKTKEEITKKTNEIAKLAALEDNTGKKRQAALQKEISQLERILALNTQKLTLLAAESKLEDKAGAQPGFFSGDAARDRIARSANTNAIALGELTQIYSNTMEKGFIGALTNMKASLERQGVGFIKKWSTLAVGALASATAAIGTLISSLTTWINIALLIGTAIYAALKYFSATKQESERTAEAIDRLSDASKNAYLTLERLNTLPLLEQISIQSIQAKANALKELGDSGFLAVKRSFDELQKMNFGDRLLNSISSMWGGDVTSKLAKTLSAGIKDSFKLAESTPETQEAKKSIERILGTSIDLTNLDKELEKLADSGQQDKLKQVVKIIEDLGNKAIISADKGTQLKESVKKISTNIQEFNKSLVPTDIMSKIGQDSITAAAQMSAALNDPVQSLNAMREASEGLDFLSIFPPDVALTLSSYSKELKLAAENTATLQKETRKYDSQLANLRAKLTVEEGRGNKEGNWYAQNLRKEIADIESKKLKLQTDLSVDLSPLKAKFDTAIKASLIRSAEQMAARLASEMTKAKDAVIGTIASMLGDTAAGIKLRAEIEKRSIDASLEVTRATFELGNQMDLLRITIERNRLTEEKERLNTQKRESRGTDSTIEGKLAKVETLISGLDLAEKIILGKAGGSSVNIAKTTGSPEAIQAAQRQEQQRVALAGGAAQKKSIDIKTEISLLEYAQKLEVERLTNSISRLSINKQNLDILKQSGKITEKEYNSALLLAETGIKEAEFAKQKADIENEYNRTLALGVKLAQEGRAVEAEEVYNRAEGLKITKNRLATDQNRIDQSNIFLQALDRELKYTLELIDKAATLSQLERDAVIAKEDSASTIRDIQIQAAEQSGVYSEQYLEALKREAEVAKAVEDAKRKEADLTIQYKIAQEKDFAKLFNELVKSDGKGTEESARLDKEMAARTKAYNAQVQGIKAVSAAQIENIGVVAKAREEQNEFNKALEGLKNVESVFRNMGSAVSDLVTALYSAGKAQDEYNASRKAADDARKAAEDKGDKAEEAKAIETIRKLDNARAKDEISNAAKIAGSVKKLFKEKTVAAKLFGAVEKTLHVLRLAMDIKEMISSGVKTAALIKDGLASAWVSGKNAIAKALDNVFPYNLVAAGVVAAAVASLLGKNVSLPAGATAAEQQEVQGTGRDYVNGKLVDNGGGAFGDNTAKSEDIAKSISMMKEYSFKLLGRNVSMLKQLEEINKNTSGLTNALIRAGFASDVSGFGTQEGKTGGALGGLFNSKSTSILDAGIKIIGSFAGLASKSGTYQQYENVQTKSSSLFGIVSSTKTTTNTKALGTTVVDAVAVLFNSMKDSILETAELFGKDTADKAKQVLSETLFNFQISTKGLTGAEIEEALKAEAGSTMNIAIKKIFPWIDEFATAGEGALTTLTRLVTQVETVNTFLELMGSTTRYLGSSMRDLSVNSLKAYDALVESVGGLEAFKESATEFVESILTESQRLAPVASEVTSKLKALGLGWVNTRAEWAQVLQTIDLTTPAGRTLYAELMNLQSGFIAVTSATEDTASSMIDFAETTFKNVFQEKFLTDAEKWGLKVLRLQDQLSELGLSGVDSMKQFKELALGIDTTSEAGKTLFNSLMKVAGAFADVYAELEKQRADFRKSLNLFGIEMSDRDVDTWINLFGSVGIATESINSYYENFVSDAEKLAVRTGELGNSFSKLVEAVDKTDNKVKTFGIRMPATREGFEALVNAAMKAGRKDVVSSLLKLAPAFAKIVPAAKAAANALKEMDLGTMGSKIKELFGSYDEQRVKVLEGLKKSEEDRLTSLNEQLDVQNNLIDSFESLQKSLIAYSKSLKLSDLSPLTPGERMTEARKQLDEVYGKAMTGDQEALAELENVASAFLSEAKDYYNSSEGYQAIFKEIQGMVDGAISSAGAQKSLAQLQREAYTALIGQATEQIKYYEEQITAITNVEKAINSVEEAVSALNIAIGDYIAAGFQRMDTDLSKTLSRSEVMSGLGLTDRQADYVFNLLDVDKNGVLSVQEAQATASAAAVEVLNEINDNTASTANDIQALEDLEYILNNSTIKVNTGTSTDDLKNIISPSEDYLKTIRDKISAILGIMERPPTSVTSATNADAGTNPTNSGNNSGTGNNVTGDVTLVTGTGSNVSLDTGSSDLTIATANASQMTDTGSVGSWTGQPMNPFGPFIPFVPREEDKMFDFDVGANYIPADMTANIHKGERIIPAADNATLMETMRTGTANSNELVAEIRKLNQKIERLERVVAEGAIANADATDRNTELVASAIKTGLSKGTYINSLGNKVALV